MTNKQLGGSPLYQVEIVNKFTGEVVKTMGSFTERIAERIENGVNINLDHMNYETKVVEVTE